MNDGKIDIGYNTDVYMTNKRLILLNTSNADYPELSISNPCTEIKRIAKDSLKEISIPTNHVKNISIDIRNQIIGKSVMRKHPMIWISVIGMIVFILKFFVCMFAMSFEGFELWLILSCILIATGFLLKTYPVEDATKKVVKIKLILLSVIEPFYGQRALLKLDVDSDKHSVVDVVTWVKNLQRKID